ncbi:MAG: hypothetical protein AAGJ46_14460 [Planctomycetota bacterium]
MPADIVTALAAGAVDAMPAVTVETNPSLGNSAGWTPVPTLRCDRLATQISGVDTCDLSYEFGTVRDIGETSFTNRTPLDILGHFIRVTVATAPGLVWYGVVVSDASPRTGVFNDNETLRERGSQQRLKAMGLEYLLGRKQVTTTVAAGAAGTERIQRARGFNTGTIAPTDDQSQRGNKATLYENNVPVFEDGSILSEEWDAGEMLTHLMEHQSPVKLVTGGGDPTEEPSPVKWEFDPASIARVEGYKPAVRTEGRSVLDLVQTIANPRRGYCWWLDFDPTGNGGLGLITLYADTLVAASLSLPDGGSVPQNTRRLSLDFDTDDRVASASVARDRAGQYSQVRVRGARMTSTFTAGVPDGTLAKDWTDDAETAYKDPGGAGADENDAARRNTIFDRVYSAFRIPSTWNRKSGDGDQAATNWAFPELSETGSVLGELPVQTAGLRMLRTTRLRKGTDYEDPIEPTNDDPDEAGPEFEPPFAFIKIDDTRYQYVDRLSNAGDGRSLTSYGLYAQQHAPGIALRGSGKPSHTLADNHWDGAEASSVTPELDYEDLRATLCCEADSYCEGVHPLSPATDETLEVLTIDVGDAYRLDFLPANTVVGLGSDGTPKVAASGVALRDDRDALRDAAQLAYDWYQQPRATLSVSWRRVARWQSAGGVTLEPGCLITTLGEGAVQQETNTVVGQIAYDFLEGTTSLRTLSGAVSIPELLT